MVTLIRDQIKTVDCGRYPAFNAATGKNNISRPQYNKSHRKKIISSQLGKFHIKYDPLNDGKSCRWTFDIGDVRRTFILDTNTNSNPDILTGLVKSVWAQISGEKFDNSAIVQIIHGSKERRHKSGRYFVFGKFTVPLTKGSRLDVSNLTSRSSGLLKSPTRVRF